MVESSYESALLYTIANSSRVLRMRTKRKIHGWLLATVVDNSIVTKMLEALNKCHKWCVGKSCQVYLWLICTVFIKLCAKPILSLGPSFCL